MFLWLDCSSHRCFTGRKESRLLVMIIVPTRPANSFFLFSFFFPYCFDFVVFLLCSGFSTSVKNDRKCAQCFSTAPPPRPITAGAGWQARGHTLSCFSCLIFCLVDGSEGKSAKMQSSADTPPAESGEGRGFNLLLGVSGLGRPSGPAVSPLSEQGRNQSLT